MHDIVTLTPGERQREALAERQRRYLVVMGACLVLLVLAAFLPAPVGVRVVVLAFAVVLAVLAGTVAHRNPF